MANMDLISVRDDSLSKMPIVLLDVMVSIE